MDGTSWRFADVLQYVVVPFFDKEKCDNVYKVICLWVYKGLSWIPWPLSPSLYPDGVYAVYP